MKADEAAKVMIVCESDKDEQEFKSKEDNHVTPFLSGLLTTMA
jgi:hypothetical protein